MSEIPVSVTDRAPETHVPENNFVESKGNKIFHNILGKATRPSKITNEGDNFEERQIAREQRSELFKEIEGTDDPIIKQELLDERNSVEKPERLDRSLDVRAKRAEILKEALKTQDRGKRKELLAKAHDLDEIEAQYLN